MLTLSSVSQIPSNRSDLIAFRIDGELSRDEMTAMAEAMNEAFNTLEWVDILMIFEGSDGAETGASVTWEALKSRLLSVNNVRRYVVVAKQNHVLKLIDMMGNVVRVRPEIVDFEDLAWQSLDATPAVG